MGYHDREPGSYWAKWYHVQKKSTIDLRKRMRDIKERLQSDAIKDMSGAEVASLVLNLMSDQPTEEKEEDGKDDNK